MNSGRGWKQAGCVRKERGRYAGLERGESIEYLLLGRRGPFLLCKATLWIGMMVLLEMMQF